MTLYWHKHPDGSMTRKLVEDWTDEERALHARHKVFLKEADALGYVFRLNTDSQKWFGAFKKDWVGLTIEEILETYGGPDGSDYVDYARAIETKLKEKNHG